MKSLLGMFLFALVLMASDRQAEAGWLSRFMADGSATADVAVEMAVENQPLPAAEAAAPAHATHPDFFTVDRMYKGFHTARHPFGPKCCENPSPCAGLWDSYCAERHSCHHRHHRSAGCGCQ